MAAPPARAPALSMAVGCGVSERASRAPARTGILYHTGDGAGRVDRCAGGTVLSQKSAGRWDTSREWLTDTSASAAEIKRRTGS